jgi:hypothetical protein
MGAKMNYDQVVKNVSMVRSLTFKNQIPDCVSCLPINWNPYTYDDEDEGVRASMANLTENEIHTGEYRNGQPLVWRFSTAIYKNKPLYDSLHYTFISTFSAYISGTKTESPLDHVFQMRLHMYNNPTIHALNPLKFNCEGVKTSPLPLMRTVCFLVMSAVEFLESVSKIYCLSEYNIETNSVDVALSILDEFRTHIEDARNRGNYNGFALHDIEELKRMLTSGERNVRNVFDFMKATAADFNGCYRMCMLFSEEWNFFDEMTLFANPVTHRGNNKGTYCISREDIEAARERYKLSRPNRNLHS